MHIQGRRHTSLCTLLFLFNIICWCVFQVNQQKLLERHPLAHHLRYHSIFSIDVHSYHLYSFISSKDAAIEIITHVNLDAYVFITLEEISRLVPLLKKGNCSCYIYTHLIASFCRDFFFFKTGALTNRSLKLEKEKSKTRKGNQSKGQSFRHI